jgi:hypothetical protein
MPVKVEVQAAAATGGKWETFPFVLWTVTYATAR